MADIEDLDSTLLPLGSSPLHVVVKSGDIKSLKLLLHSRSIQVDLLDHHGRTPLGVALQNGRFDAAQVLIESGASLEVSFDSVKGLAIAQVLAAPCFYLFLETLIQNDVFISLNTDLFVPLMHSAAYDGRASFLQKLLESYEIDINSKDNLGQTALHYASRRNNVDCVEILLKFGANVMVPNPQGSTALHLACIGGHLDVVIQLLQDWVADVAEVINVQDSQNCTPLHTVLYNKHLKLFEYLTSNYSSSFNLDLFDDSGYTIPALLFVLKFDPRFITEYSKISCILSTEEASWLLFKGVAQNDLELVSWSITNGAKVDCMDYMQQTPLILASKLGYLEVFKTLIDGGADPNVCDAGGKTPLQYASELYHVDVVNYLLSLEHFDPTPFFSRYKDPLTMELLASLIDYIASHPSRKPKNWKKWLTLAVRNQDVPLDSFSQLVSLICPYNWVECLVSREVEGDNDSITHVQSIKSLPQMLPVLVDGEDVDKRKVQVYQELRSKRMPLKKRKQLAKKIGGSFACMRQRVPCKMFMSCTQKRSHGPRSKTAAHGRPFHFHFNATTTYYPVHEAAAHGNASVLEYFLSNVRESSMSLLKQLIVETKNSCGQTVAEIIAQKFHTFHETVVKLNIGEMVMNAVCDIWPLHFNYSGSLLHYVVSGGELHIQYIMYMYMYM